MQQILWLYRRITHLVKSKTEWWLALMLLATLLVAAVGIALPETGFDAIWYHLPVIKAMVAAGSLVYLPELYQSLNPLLSDLFLAIGWWLGGETGVKVVAYLFYLGLLGLTWKIGQRFLSPNWTYLAVIMVALIQPVAWQASSAYVDVAKAMWELLAVWCLLQMLDQPTNSRASRRGWLGLGSLAWGASLATKTFSIVLGPLWLAWLVWLLPHQRWTWLWSLGLVMLVPSPFYWWAGWNVGHPLVSLALHAQKVGEIGGEPSLWRYVARQLAALWKSPWQLLVARDYVNWLVFLMAPKMVVDARRWWSDRATLLLMSLVGWQWLVWWFLPPLSTRYGLSGFVVLVLLMIRSLAAWWRNKPSWRWSLASVVVLSLIFHSAIRVGVVVRAWPYLSGQETKVEYLTRFYDGHIDQHLKSWHQLP